MLADYLTIFRRRNWVAIVAQLLIPIAAHVYSSQQPVAAR